MRVFRRRSVPAPSADLDPPVGAGQSVAHSHVVGDVYQVGGDLTIAARGVLEREWNFAHAAICRRISAVMVDVVRLMMVRSSVRAHDANNERYDEFVKIASLHLEDLRHNIAALPSIGDARQYEKVREIELRFHWLVRMFAVAVPSARVSPREMDVVREVIALTLEYFELYPGVAKDTFNATVALVRDVDAPCVSIDDDPDRAFALRQSLQTRVRAVHARDVGPGIMMDVDNELAVRYFAIDWWLLGGAATATNT